jgi:hypothetical protein
LEQRKEESSSWDHQVASDKKMPYSCLSTSDGLSSQLVTFLEGRFKKRPRTERESKSASRSTIMVSYQINDCDLYVIKILVDDQIVIDLIKAAIQDCEDKKNSFIVQGFPRTKVQALAL